MRLECSRGTVAPPRSWLTKNRKCFCKSFTCKAADRRGFLRASTRIGRQKKPYNAYMPATVVVVLIYFSQRHAPNHHTASRKIEAGVQQMFLAHTERVANGSTYIFMFPMPLHGPAQLI